MDADPHGIGADMSVSAATLIGGGTAPAVEGDDDESTLAPRRPTRSSSRSSAQAERLVHDLTATGNAVLDGENPLLVPLTAGERLTMTRSAPASSRPGRPHLERLAERRPDDRDARPTARSPA